MANIDVGASVIDRSSGSGDGYTNIEISNPANDSGTLTQFEIWCESNTSSSKIGTFSGTAPNFDDRDYEIVGAITAGSKQTYSGLNCDVEFGDYIGVYHFPASGKTEWGNGLYKAVYYTSGDQFGSGSQLYTQTAMNSNISLYGTGETAGGTNIAKINGIPVANIAKINGIAVAGIAKMNGVAV